MNSARPRLSGSALVLADATDVARVGAGSLERGRHVGQHDAGGVGEQLLGALDA